MNTPVNVNTTLVTPQHSNNRGDFVQRGGGYMNRGGRGRGRPSGRRSIVSYVGNQGILLISVIIDLT